MNEHQLLELVALHAEYRRLCLKTAREWYGPSAFQRDFCSTFVARARENHRVVMRCKRRLRGLAA